MPDPVDQPRDPDAVAEFVVADVSRELAADWDDAFAWSYGQRYWNIGCG